MQTPPRTIGKINNLSELKKFRYYCIRYKILPTNLFLLIADREREANFEDKI